LSATLHAFFVVCSVKKKTENLVF